MAVETKTFEDLVFDQAAALQSKVSSGTPDLSVGSILRSLIESNAGVGIWLESLIIQVFAMTRASTSTGADLDSWVADYGLDPVRLSGTVATGSVTFSRNSATLPAVIPVGATIDTSDGARTFAVTAGSTNIRWSATDNGYVMPVGVLSVTVPVADQSVGTAGNIAANSLTRLTVAIPYVDFVTNPTPFLNGTDEETDEALRARFVAYLGSLARGTIAAIQYAATSVPGVTSCTVVENKEVVSGNPAPGFFYVVIDDGTGTPSDNLVNLVVTEVNKYRSAGINYTVRKPSIRPVTVTADIIVSYSYTLATVKAEAEAAVASYISSLGIGETLYAAKIVQIIFDSSEGILNVANLSLTADVVPFPYEIIRPTTITISPLP